MDMERAGERWLSVGSSAESDSRRAGTLATQIALTAPDPSLLIAFCSCEHDLEQLLEGIEEAAPGVPLIGCSTAGEISTDGPDDSSVVITALGGDGFEVHTASAGVEQGLRGAGAEVARSIAALSARPHKALVLLTDGLAGDQQEVVRGAYSVVGALTPLVGGCAGDDLAMERTFQLHGREVLTGSIVGAALGSDAPIGIGVRHGWRRVGEPMLVTRSHDNRVYELEDRPALDVYLERLDAPAEARVEPQAFTQFAQTHPLGTASSGAEEHVRFVGGADFEERSLVCIAEVPQGGLAWLMEGDDASVLEATDAACSDALEGLGDERPLGVLAFDCIARRGVLGGDGIRAEVSRVAELVEGAPVAGFYTYGEIARVNGVSGFHNQTLVLLAMG